MFSHYADESFFIDRVKIVTISQSSVARNRKKDMIDDFKEVVEIYKRSPELVECIIIWNYSFQIKSGIIYYGYIEIK